MDEWRIYECNSAGDSSQMCRIWKPGHLKILWNYKPSCLEKAISVIVSGICQADFTFILISCGPCPSQHHHFHLVNEKTGAQRGFEAGYPFPPRGYAASSHIPPGTGRSVSTEMAHPIFADACFPEQTQDQVLFSGWDLWRPRETETYWSIDLSAPPLGSRNVSTGLIISFSEQVRRLGSCGWEFTANTLIWLLLWHYVIV